MKTSFRILHCLRAPVGGLFRHVCDLASAQIERGHEVAVVCETGGNALTEARLSALAPMLPLGLHRLAMRREVGIGDWLATRQIADIARRTGADALHGHGAKGGAFARLAVSAMRRQGLAPLVFYTPHGGSLHYDPRSLKGAAFMAIERRLGTFTDGFIFECRYSAERYAQAVGTPAAEWRVIPNGLMANEFAPRVADADASDVLFVGELRHLKGVDILLNALGRINHTRRVGATIVGDGPDAESFKRLARQLGIDAHVRFAGAMPAAAAFKLGHILAMPSRAESFPYIVLEAAAAGIPILATRVGGIPEIVAGTDTQLLPANDVGALVDALEATLARPDVAVAKAERLRTRIGERFTVAGMTDAVLSFYDDCRSRRSKKA